MVGIITDPGAPGGKIGCVILNAGSIHRVGPQRIYVKIARRLAQLGITCVRFDYSGIGDSPTRRDSLPFAEFAVQEARAAMDAMQETLGIEKFVALGLCWGADNALRVCHEDPRVVGGAIIDFYFVPSLRYWVRLYGRRMFSPRSWGNLLSGKSPVLRVGAGALLQSVRQLLPARAASASPDEVPAKPPREILAEVGAAVARGVDLRFVFTCGSGSWDHYQTRFRKGLDALAPSGRVAVDYLPDSDHIFTQLHSQARLLEIVAEWGVGVLERDGDGAAASVPPVDAAADG